MPFLHFTGRRLTLNLFFFFVVMAWPVHAQWITQSFELKAGYNAIYLHVDVSHATLNSLVASDPSNPIGDIWRWSPAPTTLQFVDSPQSPINQGSQFIHWSRSDPNSPLQRLIGNSAYLVRVDGQVATYTWNLKGRLRQGGTLTVTVPVDYNDQAANPFLHTYHPDHDNLDPAGNAVLPQGDESFRIERQLTLSITTPLADFDSLTRGGQQLNGNYSETITMFGRAGHSRRYQVSGFFLLKRISPIDTLTTN